MLNVSLALQDVQGIYTSPTMKVNGKGRSQAISRIISTETGQTILSRDITNRISYSLKYTNDRERK